MIHEHVLTDTLEILNEYEAHLYLVLKDRLTPTDEYTVNTELMIIDVQVPTYEMVWNLTGSRTIYAKGTVLNNFTAYIQSVNYVDPGIPRPGPLIQGSPDSIPGTFGLFEIERNFQEQRVILSLGEYDLSLPPPDFGDKEAFRHKRVNATSRGGGLIIFQDPRFVPIANKISLSFSQLTKIEARLLLDFMKYSVAYLVQYTDVYGFVHDVVIINPEVAASEVNSNNYTINVELQESLFDA